MQCHGELMRLVGLVNDLEKLMAVENPNLQLTLAPQSVKEQLYYVFNHFQLELIVRSQFI
ncbi:hypothetical protein J2S07_001166 [Robertmurraya andreesenii]|uniref:Uncharacterized protein n=1 Tax=Anoxybacillus andreesenii TaxID=1325932 RepID=A0ABT9V1T9_9BACL|nr:hypothetical protein [Robertmurraya andreesenii]MDQ0154862.1 hypothetical protein [Robertmurraya andreesenii]